MNKGTRKANIAASTVVAVVVAVLSACGPATIPALPSGGLVLLDGQTCPASPSGELDEPFAGTSCASAHDWPVSRVLLDVSYIAQDLTQRTRVTHRRPSPPGPPSDSLFVAFEATGADPIDLQTHVSFAISPTTDITDARAYLIRPATTQLAGSQTEQVPATVRSYHWDGSTWVQDATATGVTASFAFNVTLRYWGVEARVHLPGAGITGNEIRLATHWTTRAPSIAGPASGWRPSGAEPEAAPFDLPRPAPGAWTEYLLADPPSDR